MNIKNKIFRVLLSAVIIPTFVFMCAASCHCPTAQAFSGEPVIAKAPSCCCPGESNCAENPAVINKDQAAGVQVFEIGKAASTFKAVSNNSTAVSYLSSVSSITQPSAISPPNISHLATVQLLI